MDERAFDERYRQWARRSGERFTEASRYIPGGAGSSARTVKFGWKPYPPFMAEGLGSRLRDVDGHEYIDYLLGLGPMILGHRHPAVTRAVTDAISELGTCFGLPYDLEVEAARKVTEAVPGVDLVRFSNSGSEVVGTAVRLARAHTGRRLVIRFEGHYHGWQDTVYWSNHVDPALAGPAARPRPVPSGPGVPAELEATLIVLTWNDPESFTAVMEERGDQVAAVITEPAVFNTGCILPEPGYLELLREQTRRHWDTAAYVSEEAKGKQAGRAGVTSVVLLFVIYAGVILCLQGVAPSSTMQNNAANILAFVGNLIGGGGWKNVMIVAVLGGTLASLPAAIIAALAVDGDWPDGAFPPGRVAAEPDAARAAAWDGLWAAHESARGRLCG